MVGVMAKAGTKFEKAGKMEVLDKITHFDSRFCSVPCFNIILTL